jgi:hypothetical protein
MGHHHGHCDDQRHTHYCTPSRSLQSMMSVASSQRLCRQPLRLALLRAIKEGNQFGKDGHPIRPWCDIRRNQLLSLRA